MGKTNFRVFWAVLYQDHIQSVKYTDSINLFLADTERD